jgi:hypothetical protein
MNEELNKRLDASPVTLEFTVQEINVLLNVLNMPLQAPAITLAGFITAIQNQAGPQVEKTKAAFEAIQNANADGVPMDLEEKN